MPKARLDPRATLIAETEPGWSLYRRSFADVAPWRSLYLKRAGRRRNVLKRTYWLYWNGERFKRNRDAGLLSTHHPNIYDWVQVQCAGELWEPLLCDLDPPLHAVFPDNSRDWITETCLLQSLSETGA